MNNIKRERFWMGNMIKQKNEVLFMGKEKIIVAGIY